MQRSRTVHGDRAAAEQVCRELAEQAAVVRERAAPALLTVGDLLATWIGAAHDWKPSTWVGYRGTVRRLLADPVVHRSLGTLAPSTVRTVMRAWTDGGMSVSTAALNIRVVKAASGWAYDERRLAAHPLAGMRGPAPGEPRREVPVPVVRDLLARADHDVEEARGRAAGGDAHRAELLWQAEQVRLLLHLAADSGARRGELAGLRLSDRDGRELQIVRAISAEQVSTTKTGRTRRLTLGAGTTQLWQDTVHDWQKRRPDMPVGPWLFTPYADPGERITSGALGHRFTDLTRRHGHGDVTLHRLRHTVATVLVSQGRILHAQQRLGHRDASTTLRQYCHALPLEDLDVADTLEQVYRPR